MNEIRVVIMGSGGVGKSAMTIRFCHDEFDDSGHYDPTIEDVFRRQIVVDQRATVLNVLDTAGQEEFMSLQSQWISEGEGFIVVFSLINKTTFQAIEQLVERIRAVKEDESTPIIVVGNKYDLEDERQVTEEVGMEMASTLDCKYFETSAKTDHNITPVFMEIARMLHTKDNEPTPTK